jgi:hypothetical protein
VSRRRDDGGAQRRVITEYPALGSAVEIQRQLGLDRALNRGMQGLTGTVYLGDKGDPSRGRFDGHGPQLQRFVGAAQLGYVSSYYRENQAALDNGVSGSPLADPVMQVLAARAAARGSRS